MTPAELLALAEYPQFPRTARDLVRVAGLEAAAALIHARRGTVFRIPSVIGGGNPAGARQYDLLQEIVGEAAARRIVGYWGGQPLTVPSCKEAIEARDKNRMRADFDRLTLQHGYSAPEAVSELALKYDTSYRTVEKALARPDCERVAVQGCLF